MARILIVDDSIIMRRNLRVLLTKLGHEVVGEASNGHEALKKYQEHEPDIVTMDISMPELSGIEATERIINQFPDATIVIVSALKQKKDVVQAINAGAKYFIVKPFEDIKVKEVIDNIVAGK
ncbi:MAG TPA: response regulator [Candidatus Cloacimonadota bacterium]|nr:response regulator [Candidatus Cloacimonadota bacterium]